MHKNKFYSNAIYGNVLSNKFVDTVVTEGKEETLIPSLTGLIGMNSNWGTTTNNKFLTIKDVNRITLN